MSYQKRSDCTEAKGLEAAKVGVTQESTDQGGEIGGAIEDVDDVCGCDALQVEHSGEVDQEVGQGPNCSQLLESLIS